MTFMPIYYTEEELDDLIDKWHKDKNLSIPLIDYLGVSEKEYAKWVMNQNHQLLKPIGR